MNAWKTQRFILPRGLLRSVSLEEVESTWDDMMELGIAQPPYKNFHIMVAAIDCIKIVDNQGNVTTPPEDFMVLLAYTNAVGSKANAEILFPYLNNANKFFSITEVVKGMPEEKNEFFTKSMTTLATQIYQALIVLLATRNVEKETKEHKLRKLGIGKTRPGEVRPTYSTTLKVGQVTETHEAHAAGATKRPHLRRGHIRRQHWGPKNSLVKAIFIQPVFVNADETFMLQRSHYNVSGVKL